MPSAASAKLEKQASSNQAESTDNNSANTPIRQALVIIEHKIRNLEKRKTKLESYRAIQASGKELSSDQRSAVAKYDEVAQSLEFARELSKQMVQLATIAEKEQRKQARRDALLRTQAETAKIREVLTIQNILTNFADANVREDFLNGTNGAAKLEENDLQILEKFCIDIHVSRQTSPEDAPFSVSAQKAAEYLSLTIDGRPKAYGDTTFDNVRRIIQTIQDCGYLDKSGKVEPVEEFVEEPVAEQATTENEEAQSQTDLNVPSNEQQSTELVADVVNPSIPQQQQQQPQQQQQQQQPQQIISPVQALPKFPTEAPSAAAVPAPAFPQQPQPPQPAALVGAQIPQQPPQMQRPVVPSPINTSVTQGQVAPIPAGAVPPAAVNPLHAAHFPPTTVRAVEQAYFKQHQYIQQMRPLAEVIGSGNFYFLQDSELDSPDLVPSGFPPNDTQNAAPNIAAGTLPPQSPNTAQGVIPQQPQQQQQQQPLQQAQQQQQQQPPPQQQQQQQPQMPMPQPGLQQQQQKAQQQPTPAPIPTQTFTNQSFPPIVPPSAIFPPGVQNPAEITTTSTQMAPVFQAPPIPLTQIVGQPPVVVSQQSGGAVPGVLSNVVESQQQQAQQQPLQQQQVPQPPQHQAVSSVLAQPHNPPNLMTVPSGPNVPLPGFSAAAKFPANAPLGIHQVGNQMPPVTDKFEQIVPPQPTMNPEPVSMKQPDEIKDRTQIPPDPNDWDAHETGQQSMVTANTKEVIDSTQWSTEVSNASKNEWNSGFDNQGESNTWNNNQTDSYGSRSNRNNFGNNRNSSGGGTRGIRGGNAPPSSSNGYRGRPNNSYQQQQQNGRNTGVYFRNNSDNSGYYQNQNGGYSSGNKQDSGNSYGGIRTRGGTGGGPMSQSRQQAGGSSRGGGPPNSGSGAPPRNNTNSNRSNVGGSGMPTNPNRSARGNAGAYGSSRPPNSVRQQQQDVNA